MKSRRLSKQIALIGLILFGSAASAMNSAIQTDNTLSGITAFSSELSGNQHLFTLSEAQGQIAGSNLFYSFSQFNIGSGDTAWFNLNTPDLTHIISRVTGGNESFINGELKVTNAATSHITPSFFFINPSGITLGPGASVDVPGSFYASTASSLHFSDGSQYQTNDSIITSSLSAAPPESFGFLGNEAGNLILSGTEADQVNLSFKPGSNLGFFANNIHIEQTNIDNKDTTQVGLSLQLITTGSDAVNIKLTQLLNQATAGSLTINNSILDSSGNGSGSIHIRSHNSAINNSTLFANNTSAIAMTSNDGIDIHTSSFSIENSKIRSNVLSSGRGGNITVTADQALTLTNGSQIATEVKPAATGAGGNVSVFAHDLSIDGFFQRTTGITSITLSEGAAGAVTVKASSVKVANSANIGSVAPLATSGSTGNVFLTTDFLQLTRMAQVLSFGVGFGRNSDIVVDAGQILFDGQRSEKDFFYTGIVNQTLGVSDAGTTEVKAKEIKLLDGGLITSDSGGAGSSGKINVNTEQLRIDGNGNYTGVTSVARNSGHSNIVRVTADAITLLNAGEIHASTFGEGNAGEVVVKSEKIYIDDKHKNNLITGIFSNAFKGSKGQAGKVTISADSLILVNGGEISASSSSVGNAGIVTVMTNLLNIESNLKDNQISGGVSGIYAEANSGSAGAGGAVIVSANSLTMNDGAISVGSFGGKDTIGVNVSANTLGMHNGARISSSTWGNGSAGFTTVTAGELIIDNKDNNQFRESGIFSSANEGSGNAGIVTVTADRIDLIQGGHIASSTFSQGNAGELVIKADQIIIDDYGSEHFTGIATDSNSNSNGQAGKIDIDTPVLRITNNGEITSESRGTGNAGDIDIKADLLSMDSNAIISTLTTSTGNAGKILINAEKINIATGSHIDSSTQGSGSAGHISISAMNDFVIKGTKPVPFNQLGQYIGNDFTGIRSIAGAGSSGNSGFININADQNLKLYEGAQISISNQAIASSNTQLTSPSININTPILSLIGSQIVADSNGDINAGNININFKDKLHLSSAAISTITNNGSGGTINMTGGNLIFLNNSIVTTSASGQFRNSGGNINISSNALVMDTGFIQANSNALGGSGGRIAINKPTIIIPKSNNLLIGGERRENFTPSSGQNTIQAVAPNGVSIQPVIGAAQLNLSSVLANLSIDSFDSNHLSQNMCAVDEQNSLQELGKGGQRRRAHDFLLFPIH